MKTLLLLACIIAGCLPLHADPSDAPSELGYEYPKLDFRLLLRMVAQMENKPVVISSEAQLRLQTALVVPGPVSQGQIRKIIDALLLLEGYELQEDVEEIHLRKVLTEKQCDALNKGLGRKRAEPVRRLPLERVIPRKEGDPEPKQWVIVRSPEETK